MLWYMGLMTGLVILFLLIIFYMSEKIIHSYEYGYLKTTVESSFKEIYVKNGEIIVDNDMETKINTIQISVYNKNLGFVYGNNPLNFEYDDTFSDKKIIKTVKHQHTHLIILDYDRRVNWLFNIANKILWWRNFSK